MIPLMVGVEFERNTLFTARRRKNTKLYLSFKNLLFSEKLNKLFKMFGGRTCKGELDSRLRYIVNCALNSQYFTLNNVRSRIKCINPTLKRYTFSLNTVCSKLNIAHSKLNIGHYKLNNVHSQLNSVHSKLIIVNSELNIFTL